MCRVSTGYYSFEIPLDALSVTRTDRTCVDFYIILTTDIASLFLDLKCSNLCKSFDKSLKPGLLR